MLLLLALLLLPLSPADVKSRAGDIAPAPNYETALTEILQRVVTGDGLVRYELLRGDLRTDFRRVLKAVETYDPALLTTRQARLAFWLNAYNVQMLQNIIETPHVQDIFADGFGDAFFKTPFLTAGLAATLDEIEHVVLRNQDGPAALQALRPGPLDPRIHVGLNCAAVSCPRLLPAAFAPAGVDTALDDALRAFVNSPAHLRVEGDSFVLSSLLDWFGPDFDSQGKPAGTYLLSFMDPARPGYAALHKLLDGRSAAALKARPGVRFVYQWAINRA